MNIWWIKYLMTVEHMSVKFFDSVTMAASKRHLWQDNSKWSNLVVWNSISSEMYIHTSWLFCSMNKWTGYWSLTCTECHPETSLIKAASCYELLLFFSLFGCFFFFSIQCFEQEQSVVELNLNFIRLVSEMNYLDFFSAWKEREMKQENRTNIVDKE